MPSTQPTKHITKKSRKTKQNKNIKYSKQCLWWGIRNWRTSKNTLAPALSAPHSSPACALEHFLPLSFYQQIQSLIKGQEEKRGREERGDREVKRAREIDMHVGGKWEKTTNRSLSDRGGSCSGRGTCVPAASQADAKLRPTARYSARRMKGCHSNTPGPHSEINNLSTSSEKG